MSPHLAHWSTMRTTLAIAIIASLLVISTVGGPVSVDAKVFAHEQRTVKPRPGKPEGTLPDLEEVQRESQIEREPAAQVPSTVRSPKERVESFEPEQRLELNTSIVRSEYCSESFNLVLTLRLLFTNVGTMPILLQKKSFVISRFMVSQSRQKASEGKYVLAVTETLDWKAAGFSAGSEPDLSAFTTLNPGDSYSTERELPIPVLETRADLQPGKYVLQVKVPTWYYPSEWSQGVRERWRQKGFLWTETVTSNPMSFEVKRGQPAGRCVDKTP